MSKRTWIINSGAEGACYYGKEARAGERMCGWLGLLEDLEVLLGLAGLPVSPAQRVANLLDESGCPYIEKPVSPDALFALVEGLCQHSETSS